MPGRRGEDPWDNWSWVHIASGIGLGAIGLKFGWATALIVGFEVMEAILRRFKTTEGGGLFEYESWKNVGGDIVLGVAGVWLAKKFWPARALVVRPL